MKLLILSQCCKVCLKISLFSEEKHPHDYAGLQFSSQSPIMLAIVFHSFTSAFFLSFLFIFPLLHFLLIFAPHLSSHPYLLCHVPPFNQSPLCLLLSFFHFIILSSIIFSSEGSPLKPV